MPVIELSRFSDAGLEAARFATAAVAGWETTPPQMADELIELAALFGQELKARIAAKAWKPRVIAGGRASAAQ